MKRGFFLAAMITLSVLAAYAFDGKQFDRKLYSVTREQTPDGRSWIVMRADYSAILPGSPTQVLAVLRSYTDMPSIFKRIDRVEVLYEKGAEARTRQTTTVKALGFSFSNVLEFIIKNENNGESNARQTFTMVAGDGSSLKCEGAWSMEAMSLENQSRVRYTTENWIEPRYPLQEAAMRTFGAKDMEDLFVQLAEAVEARQHD